MTELKSCPFCGNAIAPKVKAWDREPIVPGYYVICDASGWDGRTGRGCGSGSGWGEDPDEAVAAWNKRTPPAPTTSTAPDGSVGERVFVAEGWNIESGKLPTANIIADGLQVLDVCYHPAGLVTLTVMSRSEESGRWDDLSVELTEAQFVKLAALASAPMFASARALRHSPPAPADEGLERAARLLDIRADSYRKAAIGLPINSCANTCASALEQAALATRDLKSKPTTPAVVRGTP